MNTLNNQDFLIDFKRSLKNMARDEASARRARVVEMVLLNNMTLKQVGEELGCSMENARRLYMKGLWRDFLNLPENRDIKYLREYYFNKQRRTQ
jgi:DNA-directed RNA polymerase specialized sigma subunit